MVNKLSLVAGRQLTAMLGSKIQGTDKSDTWHSNIALRRQLRANQVIGMFIISDLFLILQQYINKYKLFYFFYWLC